MPDRTATVEWSGTIGEGAGEVRLGSGAPPLPYRFATRFEEEPGSNPEELLAGALGACFTMALAGRLTRAGNAPGVLNTEAKASITKVDGNWTVTGIVLHVHATVEGLGQEDFEEHAQAAKESCPVSRALKAIPIELVVGELGSE
jgi:osmotically inducible protein OsmC